MHSVLPQFQLQQCNLVCMRKLLPELNSYKCNWALGIADSIIRLMSQLLQQLQEHLRHHDDVDDDEMLTIPVETVRAKIEELPDGYRMVLNLHLIDELDFVDIAEIMNTINYEVLCLVSKRIPRIYKEKGREVTALNYLDKI